MTANRMFHGRHFEMYTLSIDPRSGRKRRSLLKHYVVHELPLRR